MLTLINSTATKILRAFVYASENRNMIKRKLINPQSHREKWLKMKKGVKINHFISRTYYGSLVSPNRTY